MNTNKKIGHMIKIIRIFIGIKLKNLANDLQIKASLLSLYEQGKREPTLRFIVALCNYINIPLSQFFQLVEETDGLDLSKDQHNIIKNINKNLIHLSDVVSPHNVIKN